MNVQETQPSPLPAERDWMRESDNGVGGCDNRVEINFLVGKDMIREF